MGTEAGCRQQETVADRLPAVRCDDCEEAEGGSRAQEPACCQEGVDSLCGLMAIQTIFQPSMLELAAWCMLQYVVLCFACAEGAKSKRRA